MSQNLILLPVFAQVVLTFAVLFVMGARRHLSLRAQRKGIQDMAVAGDSDWERPAELASRNLKNLFEVPVLFYAVVAFALITRNVDITLFVLAWAFVATRLVHSVVHLSSNVVLIRGGAYIVGVIVLAAMWVNLAGNVIAVGF